MDLTVVSKMEKEVGKRIIRSIILKLAKVGNISTFKYIHSRLPVRNMVIQKDEIVNMIIDINTSAKSKGK